MSNGDKADQGGGRLLAGRYRLLSVVGSGGMGTVWRARDETLDRDVAVKEVVLHASISDEERENRHRRTLREARASARLNHPGVVTVHDVVDEDGRPWIVMELVRARSLQQIVDEDGPLPPGRVAVIGRQIAGALRAAHAIGILHRDVKPANVLVAADDRAVLTDFGIAQMAGDATLTHTGLIMGSPAYMSPERVKGDGAIPASDLWALGATLYAACEGKAPHHRSDAMAVLAAVMTMDAPPPRNAGPLAPVLAGLLERDPVRRIGADRAEEQLAAVAAGHAASQAAAQLAERAGGMQGDPGAATTDDRAWGTATAVDRSNPQYGSHAGPPAGPHDGSTQTAPPPSPSSPTPQGMPPIPVPDVPPHYPPGPDGHWTAHLPPGTTASGVGGPKNRAWIPVLAGALVALAIIIPVVAVFWPDGGSGATGQQTLQPTAQSSAPSPGPSSASGSPTGSPSASSSETALPAGLVRTRGPGYTLGVPRGWKRSEEGNRTTWNDPASSAYIQVDRTPWSGNPYDHWVTWKEEARADGNLKDFDPLTITRTSVGTVPAADIEFTWTRQDGATRARDRGVILNGRPYAVMVAMPSSGWSGNQALVDNVLNTFGPSGVG
ncbi:serine/threonine-protein kinase [Actinomadura fibrosa]|uniref:non-specific serine/threonine protein kinase n=1 Tax=Actinomadura fibrosa TaxID=111802 RepID=A0ABW2Y0J7_9ACTN|nr:serine/threonine-protein kinase [Actinomadura fibrosa]